MLHRVKSPAPLQIILPDIISINIPQGLHLLFYGFNSLRHALSCLHPEGVSSLMKDRLEKLIKTTDVDLTICPGGQSLTHLTNFGAVYYYQEIAQRIKKATFPDRISERQKGYAFLGFQHEGVDCSLQAKHLDLLIHSSTQAYYDLHSQEFVFKNKIAYQNFLLRRIYTPDLESLFERAINDPVTFKTLLFILKNHLKMRYIGWTLSEHDRMIIEHASGNKAFIKRINQSLQEMLKHYPFIEELKCELGVQTSNIDFLLKERDIETMDYLVYRANKTIETLVEDIDWLQAQVTCSSSEKINIIGEFCKQILSDRARSDDCKQKFISKIDRTLMDKIDCLKKWAQKNRPASPVTVPVHFSGSPSGARTRTFYMAKHFNTNLLKTPCEVPTIDELILKLSADAAQRFEREHNESIHRLFLFCAVIPFITYEGIALSKEYDLNKISTASLFIFLSFFSVYGANMLSRISYNLFYLERAQHLLVLQALDDMVLSSKNKNDAPLTFSMIALALKAALDTKFLINPNEFDRPLSMEGPRLFNIKTILRHIREAEEGQAEIVTLQKVLAHLCFFCTRHKLPLEEAFLSRILVAEKLDTQIESLKSELDKTFEKIASYTQAFKPIEKTFLALLSSYFSFSIQLYTLGHQENSLPLVTDFFDKTLSEHGSDPAKLHWLHTQPLNLFLQEKDNRLALALGLNELMSTKKSSQKNDQLPIMDYT